MLQPHSLDYESPHAMPRKTSIPLTSPRKSILLVEDDAGIRDVIYDILTCDGFDVDQAEDGAGAFQLAMRGGNTLPSSLTFSYLI